MKKFLILAVTSLIVLCSACACIKVSKKRVKLSGVVVQKDTALKPFDLLMINGDIDVRFVKGDTPSIHISGDSVLVNNLSIDNNGGKLKLTLQNNIFYFGRNYDIDEHLRITVTSDKFPSINLSSASELNVVGSFATTGDVNIKASGASELRGVDLTARNVSIDLTGASEMEKLNISAETAKIVLSGASELDHTNMDVQKSTMLNLSGSSSADMNGRFADAKISLSGASESELDGSFGLVDLNISGASEIEIKGTARNIIEKTSGASSVKKNISIIK